MEVHEEKYYRSVEIGDSIYVKQRATPKGWEPAYVRCASTNAMTPHQTRLFARQVTEAAQIAEQWTTERAGKPVK